MASIKNKAKFVAVDTANKNPNEVVSQIPRRMLVLGTAGSTYSGVYDTPIKINADTEIKQFELGSQLDQMLNGLFAQNNNFEVYACAIKPHSSALESTADITITGSASSNGTITFYIGGVKVPVVVKNGQTPDNVYDSIVTAISSNLSLPVKANKEEDKVTLTSKWKGETANNITLTHDLSSTELENMPKGLSVIVSEFDGGTGTVDFSKFLSNWGGENFTSIVTAFTDSDNLDKLMVRAESFYDWKECRGFYVIGGFNSEETEYLRFVENRNDKYFCAFWVEKSPTPDYMIATYSARHIENQFADSVAVQIDGILTDVMQGLVKYRDYDAKNKIVTAGGCTVIFDEYDNVKFENTVTTYKKNDAGVEDNAFALLQTLGKLQTIQYETKQAYQSDRYYQAVLVDDSAVINGSVKAVRPVMAKATMNSLITDWEGRGLLNNANASRKSVTANISKTIAGLLEVSAELFFSTPLGQIEIKLSWTLQLNS